MALSTRCMSSRSSVSSSMAAPRPACAPSRSRSRVVSRAFGNIETVSDVMQTGEVISCKPDTTVDEALEMLVRFGISGLAVLDNDRVVVGIVSDFDLLALESLGRSNKSALFPEADQTWQAFKEVKMILAKGTGKMVSDVMTANPIVVKPDTSIDEATKILVTKKIRRLPVVDDKGCMLGAISRRDIVKAAFAARKQTLEKSVFVSLDDE
eukprot:gene27215-2463_t